MFDLGKVHFASLALVTGVGVSGSKAAATSKRKKSSASKKGKKQKRDSAKGGHANINDWSSDDSSDAEPAPMPHRLNAMSDSHEEEVISVGKKKKQGDQQSAGRNKSKRGSTTHSKRKSSGKAAKQAQAKHAKASDWTSDDSSDAHPEIIPDQLEPMSESDADDCQEHDRPTTTAAAAHDKGASYLSQQRKKQAAEMRSTSELSQQDPPIAQVSGGERRSDWAQPAAMSEDEVPAAQQVQRRGRLRKARASPAPAHHAAAGQEADDIMVDLEDDVPGLEMEEADTPSVREAAREAAGRRAEEKPQEEDASVGHADQQIKRAGKTKGGVGLDSDKGSGRHVGKHQAK